MIAYIKGVASLKEFHILQTNIPHPQTEFTPITFSQWIQEIERSVSERVFFVIDSCHGTLWSNFCQHSVTGCQWFELTFFKQGKHTLLFQSLLLQQPLTNKLYFKQCCMKDFTPQEMYHLSSSGSIILGDTA